MSEEPRSPLTPPPAKAPDLRTPVSAGLARPEVPTRPTDHANTPTIAPGPINSAEPNALVGHVFGDFELVQEIGRGGMGVVYKAIQRSLEREVALKLLLAEHASNPSLLRRFLDEARAAAGLNHPNIVQVYQVGECIAGPYFVMELIDGPALEVLMARTLPVHWVVSLMTTVADAVQHAHQKGIVHRDLKPGNIMLHQQKRPVVMDFGIAKVMNRSGHTQPGAVIGTPAYMPPEQAGDHPDKIGPHSDVYALGAILYTMLTGKLPFDEGNPWRTMLRVVSDEPAPPVRAHRPEVPAKLEQITMRCLEKQIANRFASAQQLADELKRFRATLTAKPSSTSIRVALPTVVLTGPTGKQMRLFNPATVLGRAQECDVVLKSSEVSKKHCRILISTEQVIVEDLGSVNGTFVNGQQVTRARLRDGDELDLAGVLAFQVKLMGPGG